MLTNTFSVADNTGLSSFV